MTPLWFHHQNSLTRWLPVTPDRQIRSPPLFNGAGLPAVPFRTDDWPDSTLGQSKAVAAGNLAAKGCRVRH